MEAADRTLVVRAQLMVSADCTQNGAHELMTHTARATDETLGPVVGEVVNGRVPFI